MKVWSSSVVCNEHDVDVQRAEVLQAHVGSPRMAGLRLRRDLGGDLQAQRCSRYLTAASLASTVSTHRLDTALKLKVVPAKAGWSCAACLILPSVSSMIF